MIEKLLNFYCKFLDGVMAPTLALMTAMVFLNVALRYLFNDSIIASEELSRWLLVWLTFIGAVVALKEGAHLGTEMVTSRLPKIGKKICAILAGLLMIHATWVLLQGSLIQSKIDFTMTAPASGLPMAVLDIAAVFFSASALIILGLTIINIFVPIGQGEKS